MDATVLVAGRSPGRTDDGQISFYYCHGNQGLQFAAVGAAVYNRCIEQGLGHELPQEWFLQDIRD